VRGSRVRWVQAANVSLGAGTLALANDSEHELRLTNITVTGTGFINAEPRLGGVGTGNKHTIGTITLTTQTLTFNGGNDYSIDTRGCERGGQWHADKQPSLVSAC